MWLITTLVPTLIIISVKYINMHVIIIIWFLQFWSEIFSSKCHQLQTFQLQYCILIQGTSVQHSQYKLFKYSVMQMCPQHCGQKLWQFDDILMRKFLVGMVNTSQPRDPWNKLLCDCVWYYNLRDDFTNVSYTLVTESLPCCFIHSSWPPGKFDTYSNTFFHFE